MEKEVSPVDGCRAYCKKVFSFLGPHRVTDHGAVSQSPRVGGKKRLYDLISLFTVAKSEQGVSE